MIQSRCEGAEWLVANTKSWSATALRFVLKTHTSPVHEAASPFAIKHQDGNSPSVQLARGRYLRGW